MNLLKLILLILLLMICAVTFAQRERIEAVSFYNVKGLYEPFYWLDNDSLEITNTCLTINDKYEVRLIELTSVKRLKTNSQTDEIYERTYKAETNKGKCEVVTKGWMYGINEVTINHDFHGITFILSESIISNN